MANQSEPPTVTRSAREIFLRVMEADDLDARGEILESACGDDAEVRHEVESLLEQSAMAGDFLESPAIIGLREPPRIGLASALASSKEGIGDEIDVYTLKKLLGEGGCGLVYQAEQSSPVRRLVALKVIKLGMDTASVITRFQSERQALAMMEHLNIAKVFDAGATEAGRPYFVMELVDGVPITEYCDRHRLSTERRLSLFIQVCHAIQHAHQKGIIHRDVKPGNILVTESDGKPVPKVIDFGIAKATQQRLTEQTLYTAVESFIGTPAYMSPEQADLSGLDIDTRSDIYSLGALLYELLVGRPPFDPSELQRLPLDEVRRTIRESEPERPSQKFSSCADVEKVRIAELHDSDSARLSGLLRGDLDWIVMACLEKDRSRRYATASDLVSDIERHLSAMPVLARPPSTLYRAQKLLRRHGAMIAVAGVILVSLLGGATVSVMQAVRAKRAEREATDGRMKQAELREQAERGEQRAMASAAAADLNEYVADINLTQLALSEGNFGRARQLIEKHRPMENELDHRGFEWRYLSQQCLGDEHVSLPNQGSTVQCMAYSKDGRTLAIGLRDEVRLWNVATRTMMTKIPGGASSMVFLNDGKTLVSADAGTTWVVNTEDWIEVAELRGSAGPLALSADGSQLATSGRDGIQIWDTGNWFEILRLPLARPGPVAFSPDGKLVATDAAGGITLWSLADGRLMRTLDDSEGLFERGVGEVMTFSENGEHVIAPRNSTSGRGVFVLSLWNVATGEEIGLLENQPGHTGAITQLSLGSKQNLLATASLDHAIGLWDLTEQKEIAQLRGHRSEVWCLALSPSGRTVASGSKDGDVRLWPTAPAQIKDTIAGGSKSLGFSLDGSEMAVTEDESMLAIYDLKALRRMRSVSVLEPVAMGNDLKTLVQGQTDGTVEVVDLGTSQRIKLKAASGELDFLTVSGDGRFLLSKGRLQELNLWDLQNPTALVMSMRVDSALISGDAGTVIGFGLGDRVEVWSVFERRLLRDFVVPRSFGFSAALSFDGTQLAMTDGLGDFDNLVNLWDTSTGLKTGSFAGHKQSVRSLAFTPDGRTLATASSDGTLKLWNVATRQELLSIRRLGTSLRELNFSPDGQWLVGRAAGLEGGSELRLFHAPAS